MATDLLNRARANSPAPSHALILSMLHLMSLVISLEKINLYHLLSGLQHLGLCQPMRLYHFTLILIMPWLMLAMFSIFCPKIY